MFSVTMKSPFLLSVLAVLLASSSFCLAQSPATAKCQRSNFPTTSSPSFRGTCRNGRMRRFHRRIMGWKASPIAGSPWRHSCGRTTWPAVEKLGLQCIVARQQFPTPWRTMSDEQIEKTVKELVE